jgi:transposase
LEQSREEYAAGTVPTRSPANELVPTDHFYRQLDRVLDLTFVRELARNYHAATGRHSIDPVVFVNLQLVLF